MITVVGSANMDLLVRAPRLPQPGETVLGHSLLQAPGGKGANQAVAAARAGSEVVFVGRVGEDAHGSELAASLRAAGVETRHIGVDASNPTGLALIAVDDAGANTIIVVPGANGQMTPDDVERAAEPIAASAVLVVQLEIPLDVVWRAVDLAQGSGARVVLNPAPARFVPPELLRKVDVLVANETEIAALSGVGSPINPVSSARLVLDAGARAVVVTLGAEGAAVVTHDQETQLPAFPARVVDTTGAGDAFVGNLAHALEEGASLADAARFAAAAAALSVEVAGAQPAMPEGRRSHERMSEERGHA